MLTVSDIDDNAASLSLEEMKEMKNMIHQSFIKAAEVQNLQTTAPLIPDNDKTELPDNDLASELLISPEEK